jgi:hypothetical protein
MAGLRGGSDADATRRRLPAAYGEHRRRLDRGVSNEGAEVVRSAPVTASHARCTPTSDIRQPDIDEPDPEHDCRAGDDESSHAPLQ